MAQIKITQRIEFNGQSCERSIEVNAESGEILVDGIEQKLWGILQVCEYGKLEKKSDEPPPDPIIA